MIDIMQVTPFTSFQFEECVIRVIKENRKIFVVAKDVAIALGYKKIASALNQHCLLEPRYRLLQTSHGIQRMRVITELDIQSFITHSKMPAAESFKKRFLEEVLPIIKNQIGEHNHD